MVLCDYGGFSSCFLLPVGGGRLLAEKRRTCRKRSCEVPAAAVGEHQRSPSRPDDTSCRRASPRCPPQPHTPTARAAEDLKWWVCLTSPWTVTPLGRRHFPPHPTANNIFCLPETSEPDGLCPFRLGASCPRRRGVDGPRHGRACGSRGVPSTSPILRPGRAASGPQHSGTTE